MENEKKENVLPPFQPKKDIPLLSFLLIVVISIITSTFLLLPKGNKKYVNIQYNNQLLWEKEDQNKKTEISFPDKGEKRITFRNEDGILYGIEEGFSFVDGEITLTLYADYSIQIKKEDVFCNDHTCSKLGRIYTSYTPLVCLPNHFQAMIVTDQYPEFDA